MPSNSVRLPFFTPLEKGAATRPRNFEAAVACGTEVGGQDREEAAERSVA